MKTSDLREKSKKGRCLGYPGYCGKNRTTCPKFHPVTQCQRYPNCNPNQCTFLHPICETDIAKKLCKEKCNKFHPWRDS